MATITQQQPIISSPDSGDELDFGGTKAFHRAKSSETDGVFSVLELVSEPGSGVALHVHDNEDELVFVTQGEIEVTLGDQTMRASKALWHYFQEAFLMGLPTLAPYRVDCK